MPGPLDPYTEIVRAGKAQNSAQMAANFLAAASRAAAPGSDAYPYYDDDGLGGWPLLFYGYRETSHTGEVRSTLFLNADHSYTHMIIDGEGMSRQPSGLNTAPGTRVGISLFVSELVTCWDGKFEVMPGVKELDIDLVLAATLWYIDNLGLPPVFTSDAELKR